MRELHVAAAREGTRTNANSLHLISVDGDEDVLAAASCEFETHQRSHSHYYCGPLLWSLLVYVAYIIQHARALTCIYISTSPVLNIFSPTAAHLV